MESVSVTVDFPLRLTVEYLDGEIEDVFLGEYSILEALSANDLLNLRLGYRQIVD